MSNAKSIGSYNIIFLFFFLLLFNEGYGSKFDNSLFFFLLIFLILFGGYGFGY
ncbi:hypothetical protein [Defluviitalea raffinosedens]|uniref:Uncharacterized protein n=1 Tax=Defluviitalea raffinosedens TaxID=1450156 RepID=A0A7C8LF97_9FIRM|nr:hypothetical protein [Defluviitalea raffinosedens]KAE9635423.1 hypothetical protein GND95_04550 [Defluviitalea raffinosedens]MBM7684326.1 hypothetical protein [Defluviitalea raffinosedens]HHW67602.1 hypothetical protein [Candidatus Epulonipiscium sp.]